MTIIYSAINSTTYDLATNRKRILDAMRAAQSMADDSDRIHVISAMPLTGPTAQGVNAYINAPQNEKELLTIIKGLAKEGSPEDSELTTLISFPWYHREADRKPGYAFYNDKTNKPFYATALIKKGKIVGINVAVQLEYSEAGPYDDRYFAKWPANYPPVGVDLGDGSIYVGELAVEGYYLAANPTQAKNRVGSECKGVILNGPGFYNREQIQALSASEELSNHTIICGAPLGSDSGDKVGSGERLICLNGSVVASSSKDAKYSFNPTVTTKLELGKPISEDSKQQDLIKASALWMRDYLLKTNQNGFVISMSDGVNSAYTLMIANRSIDLAIEACGSLENYLDKDNFGFLRCKKEVLECLSSKGKEEAIRLLKSKVLTCIYMPNKREAKVEAQMKALVDAIGGTFQISEMNKIIESNLKALEEGLTNEPDKIALTELISTNKDLNQATLERAQVTEAGIVGNLESKISVSNTSATAVAQGRLHAGGAGQEGPISVTLALYQSQIQEHLELMAHEETEALARALEVISSSMSDESRVADDKKQELITDLMIINRTSPMQTFKLLQSQYKNLWPTDLDLLKDIDKACQVWSKTQPSRVALSNAPNLGINGRNLDRYRSVRNSRDNEYFNNGRVELKAFFLLKKCTPDVLGLFTRNPELKSYILNTDYESLDKKKIARFISEDREKNQYSIKEPKKHRVHFNSEPKPNPNTFGFHIGVASLNQTMFDFARNDTNIKAAIRDGISKNLDLLLLHELSLTGYFGDGDFDWIKNKEEGDKIFAHLVHIALYAKASNMVISIGLPVFIEGYAKPFVGQALLQGGKILSISLKATQPDGEAEYEALHFTAYQIGRMVNLQELIIPGQAEPVPIGKPVVVVADKRGYRVPIYHEQCAEAWVGVSNDGTVNKAVQDEQRYMYDLADLYPGLVVLNPSGSKNEVRYPKTKVRQLLATTAMEHNPNIAAYVYANAAGDDNGTVTADSENFTLGRDEEGALKLHQGMRHTLNEYTLSSMVVSCPIQRVEYRSQCTCLYFNSQFNSNELAIGHTTGSSASFDNLAEKSRLTPKLAEYTEITYATSAWILNTLRHHKKQAFIISLSGGADSTLGAVQIVTAVDQFIKEQVDNSGLRAESAKKEAIKALFKVYFDHLLCKKAVLEAMDSKGPDHAIKMIKDQILVCMYMPTANSSEDTLLSARTLIEGGPRYKLNKNGHLIKDIEGNWIKEPGPNLKGLGGRFLISNLQKPMEAFLLAFSGKADNFAALLEQEDIKAALDEQVNDWKHLFGEGLTSEQKLEHIVVCYSEKKLYDKQAYNAPGPDGKPCEKYAFPKKLLPLIRQAPPTWWDKSHDLAKQNLQPRIRTECPWILDYIVDAVVLYTSNLSEAAAGYSTWAGDTSLGYENGLGGIPKSDVRRILNLYEQGGLCGLEPMESLHYVNHLEPSAELRPLDKDGKYTQTDEADLMPYSNLDRIIFDMILDKKSPWQTFEALRGAVDHANKPLFKNDMERAEHIHKACWLYKDSQFKRTGGGNTPFLGNNLDPHLSQATTLFNLYLHNGRVELNLRLLAEQSGQPYDEALYNKAILDKDLRNLLTTQKLSDLRDKMRDLALGQMDKGGDAGKVIKKAMLRLKSGMDDKWNPYWINATAKLDAINRAILKLPEKADLPALLKNPESELYKALNLQRISPVTFFGRVGWNHTQSIQAVTEEMTRVL
ncbi:MAG: hypothetical protein ACHP6H_02680 [Legionellales bacterium]